MRTLKGYELTADQENRRARLAPFLTPGPTYKRSVRDSLTSLQYAEDTNQVEHWLTLAEKAAQ